MEIRLPYNWNPRHYQEPAWRAREEGVRRHCLVWHRRAGKDDFALHSTSVEAHLRVGNYWHMLPQYGQARKAIWEAINPHTGKRRIDEAFPPELRSNTRETDMTIQFTNGSQWNVVGSDNFDSLVGTPPIGIIFSEWALAKQEAWGYLRPILLENGGWAIFIYTPRGPNHGLDTYTEAKNNPGWFAELLTADDTGVFTENQLSEERRGYIAEFGEEVGAALFKQEYYCSFEASIVGAIYGDQLGRTRRDGRICQIPIDPYTEVGTMWDLGYTDSTAIWFFQLVGNRVHFVDYYEAHGADLTHYRDVLQRKAEEGNYKYSKSAMYFPHDVEHHELITGESRRAALWRLGVPAVVVPKHAVWDGIHTVRRNFYRFWFDAGKTAKGVKALTMYRREWDPSRRTMEPNPVHDWTSHAADALRTGCAMLPIFAPANNLDSPNRQVDRYRKKLASYGYSSMGH